MYITSNSAIKRLRDEAEKLAADAQAGQLSARANLAHVSPEFRGIVDAFNQVLDAVISPLNVAAEYVDRIAKGDIPPRSPTVTMATSTPSRTTSIPASIP